MANSVLVFLPPALTESFEIVMARAIDINRRQDEELVISYCSGEIKGCVANPFGINALCRECVRVCTNAIDELLPRVQCQSFEKLTVVGGPEPDDHSVDGARSTILTFYRQDPHKINYRSRNALLIPAVNRRFKEYGQATYRHACAQIQRNRPDRIEYFNGRIVPTMSLRQAAVDEGCSYCAIEVSGRDRTLFLAKNAILHDLTFLKARLAAYQLNETRRKLGISFFEGRRVGLRTNDKSYTSGQIAGDLNIDETKAIVSVFLSSTDEFMIFGDQWFTNASRDPASFVKRLRQRLPNSYEVIVRMHPNQAGDRTGQAENIYRALTKVPGLTLIGPRDKHSSYQLLDQSDVVVTFGSTIGLEATFWGKPSILLGRSAWEDAGVATVAGDAEADEVATKILAGVPVADRNEAIRVGAYMMDSLDHSSALSYDHSSSQFLANGRNYLSEKRRSLAYKLNRIIDKLFLRP